MLEIHNLGGSVMKKVLNIFSLVFNVLILGAVVWAYFFVIEVELKVVALRYFTVLSNLLVGLTALICIPFNIRGIIKNKGIPTWALLLKLIGTMGVTLTFATVIFFLAPQGNWNFAAQFGNYSFTEETFFMHLIVPVLAIVSFIFFDFSYPKLRLLPVLACLVPPVAYGAFYILNYFQGWFHNSEGSADWYGFVKVGGSPIFGALIFVGSLLVLFGLSVLFWFLNSIIHKKLNMAPSAKEEQAESEPVLELVQEEEEPVEANAVEEEQKEEAKPEPKQEAPKKEAKKEEKKAAPAPKKETKPEPKKEEKVKESAPKKAAPTKKEEKPAPKKAPAPAKKEAKPEPKKEEKTKVYHLTKRKEDDMWAITFVGGTKAVKLFKTKKEAEAALEVLTKNQGATALIRNSKGAKAGKFASSIKNTDKDK